MERRERESGVCNGIEWHYIEASFFSPNQNVALFVYVYLHGAIVGQSGYSVCQSGACFSFIFSHTLTTVMLHIGAEIVSNCSTKSINLKAYDKTEVHQPKIGCDGI